MTLYDPPSYHTADPETSRLAIDAHERSGARARNKGIVLSLVRCFPLRTAIELWQCASDEERGTLKEPQEIRRRLYDLCKTGLVYQRPERRCAIRGTRQITWEIV